MVNPMSDATHKPKINNLLDLGARPSVKVRAVLSCSLMGPSYVQEMLFLPLDTGAEQTSRPRRAFFSILSVTLKTIA